MTDAWQRTIRPSWGEVPVEPEERSTSALGMCDKSPDTRHHWMTDAVCSQSIERLACKYCHEVIYD